MTQREKRIDRRYNSDEFGQPWRSEPCDKYQQADVLDVDGLPIKTLYNDYCRCGSRKGRHDETARRDPSAVETRAPALPATTEEQV